MHRLYAALPPSQNFRQRTILLKFTELYFIDTESPADPSGHAQNMLGVAAEIADLYSVIDMAEDQISIGSAGFSPPQITIPSFVAGEISIEICRTDGGAGCSLVLAVIYLGYIIAMDDLGFSGVGWGFSFVISPTLT